MKMACNFSVSLSSFSLSCAPAANDYLAWKKLSFRTSVEQTKEEKIDTSVNISAIDPKL